MKSENKIHVILLSVYFPPILSVASNRMIAFAKYLDKDKFNVSVVTLYSDGSENVELPENVKVYYVKNSQFLKLATFKKHSSYLVHKLKALWNKIIISLNIPEYSSWQKGAYKKLKEIIEHDSQTIVIASFPVEEPLEVAIKIKAEFPEVKFIADLRDALSANPFVNEQIRSRYDNLEKRVLKSADIITTVSEPIIDDLKIKSTNSKIIFSEIRNGFDFKPGSIKKANNKFTITYAGTFYADRNPSHFFNALNSLIETKQIETPIVNFLGVSGGIIIPKVLKNTVNCFERVEYEQIIPKLKSSDALLLVQPGNGFKGLFSGKIFDYLGAMRPIIAAIDKNDVAAKLISDCNAGFVASFDNENEIANAILSAYKLWKNNESLKFNEELILEHHRSMQVLKLNQLILSLFHE
jgi:glycosyltransferase involved in cell wall biosynthesis